MVGVWVGERRSRAEQTPYTGTGRHLLGPPVSFRDVVHDMQDGPTLMDMLGTKWTQEEGRKDTKLRDNSGVETELELE